MSLNFSNRILTSVILSTILFVCLFINKFLWLYLLVITGIISFKEFNNLIQKKFKKKKRKILLYNLFSATYLGIFIFIAYYLNNNDPFSLLFAILICVFSDTGGYIVGKFVGGRKLTNISPNKTISGSIGSFIFSLFPLIIFWLFFKEIDLNFVVDNMQKNISQLIFMSLFLSLICQLGDLFISYFKRQAKVKDTGSILPGHGGLLDRIDGLIFVIPAAFMINILF